MMYLRCLPVILALPFSVAHAQSSCNTKPLNSVVQTSQDCLKALAPWQLDPQIQAYASSPEVQKMINFAIANRKADGMGNSLGECNIHVMNAVKKTSLPAWNGETAFYGSQVKNAAKNLGYQNLLESYPGMTPQDAPKGAILVYSANDKTRCNIPNSKPTQGCGHVEIKTDNGSKGKYVSDYLDPNPLAIDRRYTLTAILIYPVK